jgi:2-methylcitrate dehydratase PrpD
LFGALVHVLELDDLHRESVTHPACAVIPAAWSAARGASADGESFLTAVLHGYEAVCRIGNAVGPAHYRIWHNTGTCGPFGAAFAAATLANLDAEQTVWALGNAGTQAAGLWQFLEEGAMSKHLHAGRAAESGLVAAELAALGFTGPARILEGAKGFFAAACPDARPERVLAEPDGPWQLALTSIKPWPSCRHTHPAVDAALELHEAIGGARIVRVCIETYRAALDLCDNATPNSEYEAKFSLHHCAAAALTDGALGLDSFDAAARSRLSDLSRRAEVGIDAAIDSAYPDRWGARVRVETSRGDALVAERANCKGDPESPLSREEMCAKATRLLEGAGLGAPIVDGVLALSRDAPLPDIEALFAPSEPS